MMQADRTTKQVLHVGCGAATIAKLPAGFQDGSWAEVRFDINPDARPDIVGTITDMAAVADDSVDAIYSSHNIEHVFPHEVQSVLAEFRRVLKPEGFAVITCPDLQSVAKHVAEGNIDQPLYHSPAGPITALDILYGHIASVRRGEVYMAHRTGFTVGSLQRHATAAGFGAYGLRRREAQFDLWLIATKGVAGRERIAELMADYARR